MRKDKDILKIPELRENPFNVPDGYFTSTRKVILEAGSRSSRKRKGYGPYIIAAAASLAFIIIAGTGGVLSREEASGDYDNIDLLVFSDISEGSYYDLHALNEPAELTEEEIIEYLIYTGTTLENIESNE